MSSHSALSVCPEVAGETRVDVIVPSTHLGVERFATCGCQACPVQQDTRILKSAKAAGKSPEADCHRVCWTTDASCVRK